MVSALQRLDLGPQRLVVELPSNDGYLLQYVQQRCIRCRGIEPTHATAQAARAKRIETIERFLGKDLATELECADLVVANNVLAHVPDISDFMAGIAQLLKPNGRASIEFPHLLQLLKGNQFDTIYHEHYSYFSLRTVQRIAATADLAVVDVEHLPTHIGKLRVWLAHPAGAQPTPAVSDLLSIETAAVFAGFQQRAQAADHALSEYLLASKRQGLRVLGYGAAAKGNKMHHYAGVKPNLLPAVAVRATSKQGNILPESHIPVITPEQLAANPPDTQLVLPWNLIEEVRKQFPDTELDTAIPELKSWRPSLAVR